MEVLAYWEVLLMIVPILCLVCFFFLLWILILKSELEHAKKEIDRLSTLLTTKLGDLGKDIKIEKGRALKGREAEKNMLPLPRHQ